MPSGKTTRLFPIYSNLYYFPIQRTKEQIFVIINLFRVTFREVYLSPQVRKDSNNFYAELQMLIEFGNSECRIRVDEN